MVGACRRNAARSPRSAATVSCRDRRCAPGGRDRQERRGPAGAGWDVGDRRVREAGWRHAHAGPDESVGRSSWTAAGYARSGRNRRDAGARPGGTPRVLRSSQRTVRLGEDAPDARAKRGHDGDSDDRDQDDDQRVLDESLPTMGHPGETGEYAANGVGHKHSWPVRYRGVRHPTSTPHSRNDICVMRGTSLTSLQPYLNPSRPLAAPQIARSGRFVRSLRAGASALSSDGTAP